MKKHGRTIIFFIIFVILLLITSFLVAPREGNVYDILAVREKMADTKEETADSIDVIFAGNSLVYQDISPLQIWNLTGITSYDLSDGAMRLCDQDVLIRNMCKRQKPKLIMMDAGIMFSSASPFKDDFALPTNLVETVFPIFHYHIFYKGWDPSEKSEGRDMQKGFETSYDVKPYEGRADYMEKEADEESIEPLNRRYLNDILKYCRDNGIVFQLVALPSPKYYTGEMHKAAQEWADENGIEFLDMNYIDIGLDWSTDTKDKGGHLNFEGSKKVSEYMAGYLEEHYELTDHRDDPDYDSWNKDYEGSGLY